MRKLKLTLMIGTILTAWNVQAACVTPPDCAELGFATDASKCSGTVLKCPWNLTKAACLEVVTAPFPILYGDGTVSKDILSGKTPIGVVFDETNKLALALTDVKKSGAAGSEGMKWLNSYYDIPSLPNCEYNQGNASVDSCSVDGRSNTTLILACGSSCGGTPAATAVNSYEPTGCTKDFCKKTKWFLPSMRDLANMYSYKSQIEATLTTLNSFGAVSLGTKYYWSSTEGGSNYAWDFNMGNGNRYWSYKSGNTYVRPVIYYGEPKQASLPILYGDGTTSKEIISGKTPIGIVFDETNRLAVALTDVKQNGVAGSEPMYWSNYSYDIPSLANCNTANDCYSDGRFNTTKMLSCGSGCGGTPAATAANSYNPAGCTKDFCMNNWFLPSIRDLSNMYRNYRQIEDSLSLLNSAGVSTAHIGKSYWASNEFNDEDAWTFDIRNGSEFSTGKLALDGYVRPVVKY